MRGACISRSGYKSLFEYCTRRLHLSEHSALNRIEVARASRVFPVILDQLAEGALTLTAVRLLRPSLTLENHAQLLERARHMGKDDVQHLIARLRPQPPVPSTIRKVPAQRAASPAAQPAEGPSGQPSAADWWPSVSATVPQPSRRPVIVPLSDELYKIQVTFTRQAHDKLHVVPFAAGGKATVDNIELRCRAHNDYEAERYFGAKAMSLFRESAPAYQ